jgi:hypothetical protein
MNTIATHCQHFDRLCGERPVSGSLEGHTSAQYQDLLASLDLFEQSKNLDSLRAIIRHGWPFPSRGPKRDTSSSTFNRAMDEDIAAVFARLLATSGFDKMVQLQPDRLNVLLLYNLLARRGLEINLNAVKLHCAMYCLAPLFAKNFSLKWFKSYCDTVCDSDIFNESYRLRAAMASAILNQFKIIMSTFKIAEAWEPRFLNRLIEMDKERLSLGRGMMTYWIKGGDAIANYLERSSRMIGEAGLIGVYFHYSLHCLLFDSTCSNGFSDMLAQSHNSLHLSKIQNVSDRCANALLRLQQIQSGLQGSLEDPGCEPIVTYVNRVLS